MIAIKAFSDGFQSQTLCELQCIEMDVGGGRIREQAVKWPGPILSLRDIMSAIERVM
jgi:hypothetical protein